MRTAKSIKILKNIALDLKNNLNSIEKRGIPIIPSKITVIKKDA
jgi:hypothetical protein